MCLLQVVMMSRQLHGDAVSRAKQKYTAHQMALLYQSLNMLQGDTKPVRRLIEGKFDDVKMATETGGGSLPIELADW